MRLGLVVSLDHNIRGVRLLRLLHPTFHPVLLLTVMCRPTTVSLHDYSINPNQSGIFLSIAFLIGFARGGYQRSYVWVKSRNSLVDSVYLFIIVLTAFTAALVLIKLFNSYRIILSLDDESLPSFFLDNSGLNGKESRLGDIPRLVVNPSTVNQNFDFRILLFTLHSPLFLFELSDHVIEVRVTAIVHLNGCF